MIVYFGKRRIATVAGKRLESVTCEKCGTQFYYELTRVGTGTADAPYNVGEAAAARRADARAEKDLARRLAREAELVPCPKCHWVNDDLVLRYRRRRYRCGRWVIAFGGLAITPMLGVALANLLGQRIALPADLVFWPLAGFTVLSSLLVLTTRWLRSRIDPNQTYPRRPELPPGTPPAWIERLDARTGESSFEAVPSQLTTCKDGWVEFRPGQVAIPASCCVCMAEAATTYDAPFKVHENDEPMMVPLCARCASQLRRQWWLMALFVSIAVAVVAGIVAVCVPKASHEDRWVLFIAITAIAGPLFVLTFPALICRPYRLRVMDADRGIVRLWTRSAEFIEALAVQVRQSDGEESTKPRGRGSD